MNKKAYVILFEGSDASGKETQSRKLEEYYTSQGLHVARISFPRYESTRGGKTLYSFLKSEQAESFDFVNADPFEASLYYAADRRESKIFLEALIASKDVVILDRYVESNLLHQGGKLSTVAERIELCVFLQTLEYTLLGLPKPDKVVYLSVPPHVSQRRAQQRAKTLGTTPDIVEMNKEYVRRGFEAGQFYADRLGWDVIPCVLCDDCGGEGEIELSIEQVFGRILKVVSKDFIP